MCHLYFGLHWVCVAVCGLSLVVVSGVCSLGALFGLLTVCSSCCGARALGGWGLSGHGTGLSCSIEAFRIFLDLGLSLSSLYWQADS